MGPSALSDILGWTSIGCWLGAQFPQVLENVRRQSCEGLALPFLLNWLLGDITNLAGCLMTHQLPFQTLLATYFVSVDLMLFGQYFYYRLPTPPAPAPPEHEHHYRELSSAAANVAIAAALAASEEELHVHAKGPAGSPARRRRASTSIMRNEAAEAEDAVDEVALAALADSFHSEGGGGGGRKRVAWSEGRGASTSRTRAVALSPLTAIRASLPLHPDTDTELGADGAGGGRPGLGLGLDPGARGRPRQRQVVETPLDDEDLEEQGEVLSRAASRSAVMDRRNSRASHRSVGLVFLGVWVLFGIGTFSGSKQSLDVGMPSHSRGVVLSRESLPQTLYHDPVLASYREATESDPPPEPSSGRILGRLAAWTCTTLYLTSRLPQIWKNFVRKSVEGLSMYLFIFAFLGNTFYVLSILASPMMSQPRPESTAFLLESIPYLLGSAGTLLFDVTIVAQSVIYRPTPGHLHLAHHHHHHHPHAHRHRCPSSYSRSRAGSHAQHPRRGRSLSGAHAPLGVEAEAQPLLGAEAGARDVELGVEGEWARQPGHARRRKDVGDAEDAQQSPV